MYFNFFNFAGVRSKKKKKRLLVHGKILLFAGSILKTQNFLLQGLIV